MTRVEKMFERIMSKLNDPPEFLLCVLPERKNCDLYGSNCAVPLSNFTDFLFFHIVCFVLFYELVCTHRTLEEKMSE